MRLICSSTVDGAGASSDGAGGTVDGAADGTAGTVEGAGGTFDDAGRAGCGWFFWTESDFLAGTLAGCGASFWQPIVTTMNTAGANPRRRVQYNCFFIDFLFYERLFSSQRVSFFRYANMTLSKRIINEGPPRYVVGCPLPFVDCPRFARWASAGF